MSSYVAGLSMRSKPSTYGIGKRAKTANKAGDSDINDYGKYCLLSVVLHS